MNTTLQVTANDKLISIVMPVYNAQEYLVECIESVQKQTYANWELIAVNDGSTDNSNIILDNFAKKDGRIRVFSFSKNKGLASALNYGILQANGYYLARMDADDVCYPKRLETQIKHLEKNHGVIAVGSQVELINNVGKRLGYKKFATDIKAVREGIFNFIPLQHPTLFTYTSIMRQCLYEKVPTAEDVLLFFKLLQFGEITNTKETLLAYRITNISNSFKNPKRTFFITLSHRLRAVTHMGYIPSFKSIFINIAQFVVVSLLPNTSLLALYELIRFKKVTIRKVIQHVVVPVFAIKEA
jgi:glycosyltransferase involved in cell wall biosynthesis